MSATTRLPFVTIPRVNDIKLRDENMFLKKLKSPVEIPCDNVGVVAYEISRKTGSNLRSACRPLRITWHKTKKVVPMIIGRRKCNKQVRRMELANLQNVSRAEGILVRQILSVVLVGY